MSSCAWPHLRCPTQTSRQPDAERTSTRWAPSASTSANLDTTCLGPLGSQRSKWGRKHHLTGAGRRRLRSGCLITHFLAGGHTHCSSCSVLWESRRTLCITVCQLCDSQARDLTSLGLSFSTKKMGLMMIIYLTGLL